MAIGYEAVGAQDLGRRFRIQVQLCFGWLGNPCFRWLGHPFECLIFAGFLLAEVKKQHVDKVTHRDAFTYSIGFRVPGVSQDWAGRAGEF